MTRLATIGLLICLALVADSEARRSAAERRAAKQSKRRASAASQVKAQSYRRVVRDGIDAPNEKDGSVFESIKDQAPTPMRLGKATPEILHKLSWALPSSLREELVEKMWRLGYDPEFTSEGPMGKLYGGGFNQAPAMAKPQEPAKKTSLLQKGAARQQKTETKARSLREKVIEATPEQLLDAEMALKRFTLEEIGKANARYPSIEEQKPIRDSVKALVDKAQRTMVNEGTLKIV